jgi:pimeloyl-ACP methyl ester carboxylesterase
MYIHESGTRSTPTIVFLHGNASSSNMWKAHFTYLADFHCLAPDFPGFGRSSSEEWNSLDCTADQVAQVIREQAAGGRAHIVGLSLGGSVGLLLLGKYPDLVDHAVIDGAGVIPIAIAPVMKLGFRLIAPIVKTSSIIRLMAKFLNLPDEEFAVFRRDMRAMSARSFRRSWSQALDLRCPPGLENVSCPSLFVAGEKELKETHQSNRMLAKMMPQAQCRVAPKMGHGWLSEAAELHCRMVCAWINDQPLPPELQDMDA